MALIRKSYFILFLLLAAGISNLCRAQILIGNENDSSWMEKEIPSEVLARKKFTLKRKLIQNLVTRFNSYYNARTKLEETLKQARKTHQDDYDSLLTQYPESPQDFDALGGNLDSVIFDAGYGIHIHDPRSKWIDNLYLIAGKAYYFKQDYLNAISAFQFIIKNKGEKNAENTPEVIGSRGYTSQQQISVATPEKKKLFYHRPSRNDAFIWLIRTYIDSGTYDLASSLINTVQNDPTFPSRLTPNLLAMQSRLLFARQQIDTGMAALENAASKEKDHILKSRWYFILGQYFEKQSDWQKAIHYYDLAAGLRPAPLMRFYAKLNVIGVHIQQDSSNYSSAMEEMLDMARREKYELYRSIIYYHLARYALLSKHSDEAVAYLQKALLFNRDDARQKLKNYYLAAQVLYISGRYREAQKYYDSTAMLMDASFRHQDEVVLRQSALGDLVVQLDIVDRQDSLQGLAAMAPPELQNYLEKIVSDSMKARRKRNLFISGPAPNQGEISMTSENGGLTSQQEGTGNKTWYFYNPELKAKGFSAFRSTWGKRPLSDNWRTATSGTSNRQQVNAAQLTSDSAVAALGATGPDSVDSQLNQLMAPIPLTAEKMKRSNDSVREAMYKEAVIFSDRLANDTAAINTLKKLLNRFPDNAELAAIYYRLRVLFARTGNNREASHYQQLLSEKYPTSKFNAALAHPQQSETYSRQITRQLYEQAYLDYLNGNYAAVQTLKDSAAVINPDNEQQARFDLLSAMAAIKSQPDTSAGKNLLQAVIDKHKNDTAIVVQAAAILEALNHKQELIEHLAHLQLPEASADTATERRPVARPSPSDTTRVAVDQPQPAAIPAPKPEQKDSVKAVPPVQATRPVTPYKANAKDSYFVILLFNHTDTRVINDCLGKFVAYNQKQHTGDSIEVSTYLINQQVMLIFRLFPGELQALKYYKEIKQLAPRQIITGLPANYYNLFIISRDNFILLNSTKDLSGYLKFFSENYR